MSSSFLQNNAFVPFRCAQWAIFSDGTKWLISSPFTHHYPSCQWIGLSEKLQEHPIFIPYFMGKSDWFPVQIFPSNPLTMAIGRSLALPSQLHPLRSMPAISVRAYHPAVQQCFIMRAVVSRASYTQIPKSHEPWNTGWKGNPIYWILLDYEIIWKHIKNSIPELIINQQGCHAATPVMHISWMARNLLRPACFGVPPAIKSRKPQVPASIGSW